MGAPAMQQVRTSQGLTIFEWILRLIAAAILLQTLFFKFTGAPESIYIFTKVGAEPWGRIGSGVVELIASVLLLYPRTTWLGAVIALGVMAGAIFSHLTVLGIDVQGDGGLLFGLAVTVFVCASALLFLERKHLPIVGGRL
jgi:putative oxidoreductase